jgi:hypothetical protein
VGLVSGGAAGRGVSWSALDGRGHHQLFGQRALARRERLRRPGRLLRLTLPSGLRGFQAPDLVVRPIPRWFLMSTPV